MNIQSECLVCLINQIEKAYRNLKIPYTNGDMVAIQKQLMGKLAQVKSPSMPYYSQALYQGLAEIIGKEDPYRELKKQSTQLALSLRDRVERELQQSTSPLLTAITIAVLGNTIDYGTGHKINLAEDVHNFDLSALKINHFAQFREDFTAATKIFVIGDNAGEAVFDGIMLKYFHEHFPNKQITYAVRGGPAINDSTIEDIGETGIEQICRVVEGSASPGIIFEQGSLEFQAAFHEADLILSKGQGNFESLDDSQETSAPIYFLLKAKCSLVASMFDVPLGALIFYRRTGFEDFTQKEGI